MELSRKIYSKNLNRNQKEAIKVAFDNVFTEFGINKDDFNVIFESNTQPKILYHYTSLNTFQAILSRLENEEKNSKNIKNCKPLVLRATHIEFLNDLSEFKEAIKLMADLLIKFEDNLDQGRNKNLSQKLTKDYWKDLATLFNFMTPPFITSFSINWDNLPMWNSYGQGGKGVAIGIEKVNINNSIYQTKSGKPVWAKCVYDSHDLESAFYEIIESLYDMIEIIADGIRIHGFPNSNKFAAFFSLLKHAAFNYEQEWRLIKSCSSIDIEKEISFQECDSILRPYIEHRFLKSVLKEVVVGPCFDMEMSRKSIEMSLNRAGYSVSETEKNNENYVEIRSSNIPYRNIIKTTDHQ